MAALRERPIIHEGPATWSNCSLTRWEWLLWKLGIGWKHEFSKRQTQWDDGRGLRVTEFQCWHNKTTGKSRCVPVTYFAPPSP